MLFKQESSPSYRIQIIKYLTETCYYQFCHTFTKHRFTVMVFMLLLYSTHLKDLAHMLYFVPVRSLAPGRCGSNFESAMCDRLISWSLLLKLFWGECHGTHLMISEHWFKYALVALNNKAVKYKSTDWIHPCNLAWFRKLHQELWHRLRHGWVIASHFFLRQWS